MIFLTKNKSEAVERRGKNGGTSEVGSKGEDQGDDEDKNFILFFFFVFAFIKSNWRLTRKHLKVNSKLYLPFNSYVINDYTNKSCCVCRW